MTPIKVKILSNNSIVTPSKYSKIIAEINMNWLYLKHWYDLNGKGNVEWLSPGIIFKSNDDTEAYVNSLLTENVDVVGFSIFAWNEDYQYKIAKLLKEKSPETKVIFGGPQLTVHKPDDSFTNNTDFFKRHPYVDYVVYGDGERPLQQILDYDYFDIGSKDDFVNIVENCSGERKIYKHETMRDPEYWASDPYTPNKDYIYRVSDELAALGIGKSSQRWGVEFARGCMYKCSYCDWSQNLSKKVMRRKMPWRELIDFWAEMDVVIQETDSNFGMWREDLLLFDYALSKFDPKRNFKLLIENTPKLDLKATEHIYINSIKTYGKSVNYMSKISMQDIHSEVLSAVSRPSLPWEDVKASIKRIIDETEGYTDFGVTEELIIGLPNQTLDHVAESLSEFFIVNKGKPPTTLAKVHRLAFLPNSPMADEEYRKKWGLEFRYEYRVSSMYPKPYLEVGDVEETFKGIKDDINFYAVPNIYKTNHMTRLEIQTGHTLVRLIDKSRTVLRRILVKYGELALKKAITEVLKAKALEETKRTTRLDLEEKYQVAFAGIIRENKFLKGWG